MARVGIVEDVVFSTAPIRFPVRPESAIAKKGNSLHVFGMVIAFDRLANRERRCFSADFESYKINLQVEAVWSRQAINACSRLPQLVAGEDASLLRVRFHYSQAAETSASVPSLFANPAVTSGW